MSQQSASMSYLGHATVLLEIDGVRILTDPLLRERTVHLRRGPIIERAMILERIDAVVISHLHLDHFDLPSLRMISRDTAMFVPRGGGRLLAAAGFENVTEVDLGDRHMVSSIAVDLTPADHDGFRPPFGPRTECVGYRFTGRTTSVYFAGDTDLFPGMREIGDNLDVALLPVWGWGPTLGEGHLDPRRAAQALTLLRPRLAIPIHWGTLCPIGLRWTRPRFLIDPPVHFVQRARQVASNVETRVVEPGRRTSLTQ